jgi:urea transport system ATP-binding protein
MLTVENANLHYGAAQALRGVSLKAEMGKITCVLGRNGVGKSSLCAPSPASIRCRAERHVQRYQAQRLKPLSAPSRASAMCRRARDLSAADGEGKPRDRLCAAVARRPQYSRRYLQPVSGAADHARRRGGDLSGGQQQQLAIGRALVTRPKLLVLDEPTEGIQPSIIKDIGRAIRYLRDSTGMAILLVEQYLDFCRELADYVYIMDRGEIVHEGLAETLDTPEARRHLTV